MVQQQKSDGDSYERELAALEAKLARSYRTIKRLRQENEQLRAEINYWRGNSASGDVSGVQNKPKATLQRRRKRVPKRERNQNLILRLFVGLVRLLWWLIGGVFALVLFIPRLLLGKNNRQSTSDSQTAKSSDKGKKSPYLAMFTVLAIGTLGLFSRNLRQQTTPQSYPSLPAVSSLPLIQSNGEVIYNLRQPPQFKSSQDLQAVVDELVSLAASRNLPKSDLSISLINVNSGEIAAFQENEPRYPASVVKLFWLVALHGHLQANSLPHSQKLHNDVAKMMQHSENDAASRIIDHITGVKSGSSLSESELQAWIHQRRQINRFFSKAGYSNIDISHKTYPINYLRHNKPQGRDEQMRRTRNPVLRNQITTQHAARLMYEIVTQQALSPESSRQIASWIGRNLQEDTTEEGGFDPIRGFFGASLPKNVLLLSKAGWTSRGRHEVAFVSSKDGRTAYILSVFAEDEAYSKDWQIFPRMSNLVYDHISQKQLQNLPEEKLGG